MVKVAKRIPAPTRPGPTKYPWATMKLRESFLFPAEIKAPRIQASQAGKRYAPRQFETRTMPDSKRVRCWRVK